MKKIILGIVVCILAVSLNGCVEEGYHDPVQTTTSVESGYVETTSTVVEETTTTNEVTTTKTTTGSTTTTTKTIKETTTRITTTHSTVTAEQAQATYILNTKSKKFHFPSCHHAAKIKEENRQQFTGSRQQVINMEYTPCGTCKP